MSTSASNKRSHEDSKSTSNIPSKLEYSVAFVKDVKESANLFTHFFGFHIREESPHWITLVGSDENGAIIGLHKASEDEPAGTVSLCFTVKDAFAFHTELVKYAGVTVVKQPKEETWGVKADYKTPEGTLISIIQENPSTKEKETNEKKQKLERGENRPSKLDWAVVSTTDSKKSIAFYTEMLGFSLKMEIPGWSEVEGTNGTLIGLMPVPKDSGTAHFAFNVPCLEKFHQEISKDSRVKVQQEPKREHGTHRAGYITQDGVYLSVLEEKEEKKVGNGICHVNIACEDLVRAKKFYEDVFGWEITQWDNNPYYLYKTNDSSYSVSGGLMLSKERQSYPSLHLNVQDIDCTVEKIKNAGGSIVKEKFGLAGGFIVHLKDTEGNIIGLWSK